MGGTNGAAMLAFESGYQRGVLRIVDVDGLIRGGRG